MALPPSQLEQFLGGLAVSDSAIGLVVTQNDPETCIMPDQQQKFFSHTITVDADSDAETTLRQLIAATKEQQWCRIDVGDAAFPASVYNQLRNIVTMGHLQTINAGEGSEVEETRWSEDAKIVLVINKDALENISIPTFLNLFGPILRES